MGVGVGDDLDRYPQPVDAVVGGAVDASEDQASDGAGFVVDDGGEPGGVVGVGLGVAAAEVVLGCDEGRLGGFVLSSVRSASSSGQAMAALASSKDRIGGSAWGPSSSTSWATLSGIRTGSVRWAMRKSGSSSARLP